MSNNTQIKSGYLYVTKSKVCGDEEDIYRLGESSKSKLSENNVVYQSQIMDDSVFAKASCFIFLDEYRIEKNKSFIKCKLCEVIKVINTVYGLMNIPRTKEIIAQAKHNMMIQNLPKN